MEWITGPTEASPSLVYQGGITLPCVPTVTLISFYSTLLEPLFHVLFRSHPESGISLTCHGVLRFENVLPLENVWGNLMHMYCTAGFMCKVQIFTKFASEHGIRKYFH